MRARRALYLAAALLAVFATGDVGAQNAVPETPPELRDFRLDPERAQPQPEPQPTVQPTVTPPAAVQTLPESAPARPAARSTPVPSRQATPTTASPTTEHLPTAAPDTKLLPERPPSQAAVEMGAATAHEATAAKYSVDATSASPSWWVVITGLGAGAMALLAFFLWKRRRRETALEPEIQESAIKDHPVEPAPELDAMPVAVPVFIKPPEEKPSVTMNFVPEKATISFTSLTVRGQLQLINEGKAPAKNMQLRAGLMSASADQVGVIEAFHQSAASIPAEQLGEAQPGERIGMAIELSVPLTELQSFPLGDQQLLVPIFVANLSYSNGVTSAECAYIACMIGREAKPPQLKMVPLRLDLGPRSFAPLGQRPVLV